MRFERSEIINDRVLLELEAIDVLHPVHEAQLMTYMRLARVRLGFLVDFNAVPLAQGILRRIL